MFVIGYSALFVACNHDIKRLYNPTYVYIPVFSMSDISSVKSERIITFVTGFFLRVISEAMARHYRDVLPPSAARSHPGALIPRLPLRDL